MCGGCGRCPDFTAASSARHFTMAPCNCATSRVESAPAHATLSPSPFRCSIMKVLFLDCFSGISGDMTVGALVDLGIKPSTLEWELSKLDLGDFHMHFERKLRQQVEGVKFGIHEGATHTHD